MNPRFSVVPYLFVLLLMVPVYWMFVLSVQGAGGQAVQFFPSNPSPRYYLYILSDPDWYLGYVNALIYVMINVVITITVAIPAAYAFSRYRFPASRFLFFALLMLRMMVPAILLVPFVQMFSLVDLIDTHIAVALAHCFFTVPLAIWILEGFISDVPVELDESAAIDGYTTFGFFRRILLPQIATGIAVTAFFCFMFSWIEFLLSNALTTIDAKPFGGIMTRAANVLSAHVPLLAAAGVLGLIPGALFAVTVRHHLARGFSLGRVK
jgi:glycerol transport system permease protein